MKLILSPKDTVAKITLENVRTFAQEGHTVCVCFTDGRIRNYPFMHIWYYESNVDDHKTI